MASTAATTPVSIVHLDKEHRFVAALPDGSKATLSYREVPAPEGASGTAIDIWQTYSPPAARGMGLAAKLADEAVAMAAARSQPIVASCSYIRDTYLPGGKGKASLYRVVEGSDGMVALPVGKGAPAPTPATPAGKPLT